MLGWPADGSLNRHGAGHTQGQAGHQNTERILPSAETPAVDTSMSHPVGMLRVMRPDTYGRIVERARPGSA